MTGGMESPTPAAPLATLANIEDPPSAMISVSHPLKCRRQAKNINDNGSSLAAVATRAATTSQPPFVG